MHVSLIPETLFYIGSFPVTNTLLACFLTVLLIISGVVILRRKMQVVPKGFQNVIETLVEFILNMLEGVFGSKKQSEQFFPLIFTIFIFVLVANWLGIMPGFGSLTLNNGHETVPLLRSATADLNATFALATVAVVVIQFMGIYSLGLFRYGKRFINFGGPMKFFVGLIELLGEFSKFIAFSFRLFGNVFGGKVLLALMLFFVPFLLPVPFYGFELFVGLIQAFIFALLTAVFIRVATMDLTEAH